MASADRDSGLLTSPAAPPAAHATDAPPAAAPPSAANSNAAQAHERAHDSADRIAPPDQDRGASDDPGPTGSAATPAGKGVQAMAASAATVAPPPTVDRASSRKATTQFTFHEDPPTPEAVPESAAPSKTLPRLDTSTSSAASSARGPRSASDALISPSSARASDSGFSPSSSRPPKPPSRPPSRPPSLSRPPSVYRPRSPSSVSRLSSSGGAGGSYGGPGTTLHTDPKRLSASSGTSGGGGGHGGFSPSSPRSPARSSGGVATSPQIPEDATVSAASSTTSTDQTTPSPSAAVAEPPPMPKASERGAAPPAASGVVAPTEDPAAPAATAEPSADSTTASADLPVFVRDYAFPREDPRFKGEMLPEEIEAAARKQRFRESGAEQGFLVDEDGMGPAVGGAGGAGGNSSFHWGFVTCHTADFPGSEVEDDEYESGDGHVGYGVYDPTHAGFGDYGEEGDEDEDGDDEDEDDAELGEFVPGVYSAVFAFEPELDTEMRLVEGELVSVFERQCRGWVQAGRIVDNVVTEEIGLVPENYLALVEPHEGVVDWSSHDFEHEPEHLHEHEQDPEHTVKPAVGAAALSADQVPHARSEAVPA